MPAYNTKKKKIWNKEKCKWEWIAKSNPETTKDGREWYFMVNYTDIYGNSKRYKSKKFNTEKEATEEEAKFKINKNEQSSKIKINDLYIEYYNYNKLKLKESSLQSIDYKMKKHILPYFKDKYIDKITTKDIIKWQEELNNYSHAYKNSLHICFSSFMNYAVKNQYINRNVLRVVGNFRKDKEVKKEMLFWDINEFNTFIKYVDNDVYKAFYTTLFFTGMRRGEAQALTWKDIKDNEIIICKTLSTKIKSKSFSITSPKTTKSNRKIIMPNIVKYKLIELKKSYKSFKNFSDDWFVFGGITYLPDETIRMKKNRACEEARKNGNKLKTIRIHDFRHSFASMLINNGVIIQIVSEMLGHEKVSTTMDIYGHLYPNQQKIAIDILNKL